MTLKTVNARLLAALLGFTVLASTAGPAQAVLSLAAEINPDPAEPGELVDVQISVSSTTTTGSLTVRLLWPQHLDRFPVITDGGGCPGGGCDAGEFLTWNLSPLGPGTGVTLGFSEAVSSSVADGTVIPFEIQLLEGGASAGNLVDSIEVQADSPLELAVQPLTAPAGASDTLVYEIVYGNTGSASAASTELSLPIPAGAQFVSATGGGLLSGNTVSWDLGSLAANSGGRERLSVQVDSGMADGTLLVVDGASLAGEVNFQPRESRAMAVSRVDAASLELDLEVNPDPVAAGELMDVQVSVSNPNDTVTGSLTLRLLWPEHADRFPVTTGGGGCPGGGCDAGEYLSWDLGVLGPGVGVTIGFNEAVAGSAVDGTLIPFELELFEGGLPAKERSATVIVRSDSPLELALDPLADPVAANGTLTYELTFGNTGNASAENTELSFPVPAGTSFLSATGGGAHSGGTVTWDVGSFPAFSEGRERVTVEVDDLADGTLLAVDAATLAGDVNFQPRDSRAMAVSRVGTDPLELEVEINPDPGEPGELLDVQISVSNPTDTVKGNLTLRVLWPEHVDRFPVATGGGACPGGGCDAGEYMTWTLGSLGPGVGLTIGFNEAIAGSVADGTLIPFELELFEGAFPSRSRSHTVVVRSDSPLELTLDPLTDPVAPGGTLIYELTYSNTGNASAVNAELSLPIPAGAQFLAATWGARLSGDTVSWDLGSLAVNSGGRQQVAVRVDADLADATLLIVDAATLSGEVNFQPRGSRARAVSRVDAGPLELDVDLAPDPAAPGELLDAQLTVTNPTANTTGELVLRVLWPEHVDRFPVVTGGGACPGGGCDAGEYLTWSLGLLGAGASVTVDFTETVDSSAVEGTLVPFEIELFEGDLPARSVNRTIRIGDQFTDPGAFGPSRLSATGADLVVPGIGTGTFLGLRNHLSSSQRVKLSYYGNTVTVGDLLGEETLTLGPNATATVPMAGAPAATAVVLVEDADPTRRTVSGDVLRVDAANNFATGERAVTAQDFGSRQEIRFLDFGSGSEVTVLLDVPAGDGASYSFVAYDEAGNRIRAGNRTSSAHFDRFPVSELVGDGNRFGTLIFDFTSDGWVSARYQAFGLFSAEVAADGDRETPSGADLVVAGTSDGAFLGLRNHRGSSQDVTLSYYGETVAGAPLGEDTLSLGPNATATVPLAGAPAGTAIVLVEDSTAGSRRISGDVLRVDAANNFATGERAITTPDFCSRHEIRYLDFGSGSEITVLLDPASPAASYTFQAFDESGAEVASGERMTSEHFHRFPVSDLVGAGNRFGTLVFDFPDGGWVSARYQAFGLFSVEIAGDCRP